RCKLKHAPLNDDFKFVALSYVWGDANDRVVMELNGQDFFITRNLFHVIRQFRDHIAQGQLRDEKFWFWIDAICIYLD
ncbi:hypothetical protein K469DRAFT_442019, partial [Zopfia rhizophila CBS 207.26]